MIKHHELLICAFDPFFLEKDLRWLSDNFVNIKRASLSEAFWKNRVLFLKEGESYSATWLLTRLSDLGFEKVQFVESLGEFSFFGGVLTVCFQSEKFFKVEFLGNQVESLSEYKPEFLQKKKTPTREIFKACAGEYLVHLDHGIGLFQGFANESSSKHVCASFNEFLSLGGFEDRGYFVIEYAAPRRGAEPDRLFVPFSKSDKLSYYSGFVKPSLHRLGSQAWMLQKKKAKQEIINFAKELLEIYAKREISSRVPYPISLEAESILESSFLFEETPDQIRALKEINHDLSQPKPMDRVLVGDVGFGKTEVALRTAVRVALSGKQVALIAPTTILAFQHFELFKKRLKDFPLEISFLSRLVKPQKVKEEKKKILEGKADIIIGTHRLLSSDLKFNNLGYLIIDEEQRFGVKHKEKLKQLKNNIDILSLSATPIPRTLYLGLSGLRQISRLETPPPQRLPTRTFVVPFSWEKIKEALILEKSRGGQIYLLYNRIAVLEKIRLKLKKLAPQIKVSVIHGRQSENELLRSISDFRDQKTDLLLATTIIENGLDISTANTLLVVDAFRLGLSEMHQLRGRIGRRDQASYAYFFYQPKSLKDKARERLRILKKYQDLGAGFEIAKKDLELRGAGNILGKAQSGTINMIGLNLYLEMLAQALEEARGE